MTKLQGTETYIKDKVQKHAYMLSLDTANESDTNKRLKRKK